MSNGRRHNKSHNHGTVNTNVARSAPKGEDMGGGVLKRRGSPNFVKVGPFGKLVSLTARERDFALAPTETPNVIEAAAE
jgi:hypothetical protein